MALTARAADVEHVFFLSILYDECRYTQAAPAPACNSRTNVKTTSEFRNVSVTVTVSVTVGVVDTRYGVSQPGAEAER